jgi:hypothetical protein
MKYFIKWRMLYIKQGLLFNVKVCLDYKFWLMLVPHVNTRLKIKKMLNFYQVLKNSFGIDNYLKFKLEYNKKSYTVKFIEHKNPRLKHDFAKEFIDIIYPYLVKEQKQKINKAIEEIEKVNFSKMSFQKSTRFKSWYYYPFYVKKFWNIEGSYFNSNFNLEEKSVVYDIGCHIGTFSIVSGALVGEEGVVYAFNPLDKFNKLINDNAKLNKLNNIIIINEGFGEKETRGDMHY